MNKQHKYDLEKIPRLFNFPCKVLEFGWLPNHSHWHENAVVEGGFVCLSCNYMEESVMLVDGEPCSKKVGGPPCLSLLMPGSVLNSIKATRHDEIFFRYSAEDARFLANFFGAADQKRYRVFFRNFPTDILSELRAAAAQLDQAGSADRIDILAIRLFSEAVLRKIEDGEKVNHNDVKLNAVAEELVRGRNLNELLKEYGMSERTFYREWQKLYQLTPHEYVLQTHLKNACSLLAGSDMPIGDIARRCGFVNSNYFYKMFRQKLNITPGEYRKSHSGKLFAAAELPSEYGK